MDDKEWGPLPFTSQKPTTYDIWRTKMVKLSVLDRLIEEGLGDTPQDKITRERFERAMAGFKG